MERTTIKTGKTTYPESISAKMIAPCGMNCGLCIGHLREKKRCPGCNGDDAEKPKVCVVCRIRHCENMGAREKKFCFQCDKFPCARLRQLDKRYRTKYGMSMIENLESLRELGLERFVRREKNRWKCPKCGAVVCVHKRDCIYCGRVRS
jgi:hypothetical protein